MKKANKVIARIESQDEWRRLAWQQQQKKEKKKRGSINGWYVLTLAEKFARENRSQKGGTSRMARQSRRHRVALGPSK
jgi:hypothetical protein